MKKNVILALLVVGLSRISVADYATAPVGFIKFTIPAGSASTPSLSLISAPMYSNPVDVGAVTSVGASTLSNSSANWSAFTSCSIHMITGSAMGQYFPITSNTSTQLTLDTLASKGNVDLTSLIAVGDKYEIYPNWTLASLFGSTAGSVQFLSGNTATKADNILVQRNGVLITYFWDGNKWRSTGLTNRNNDPIYKDDGILISHRGTSAITLTIAGLVSTVPQQTEIPGGVCSLIANRHALDTTVAGLGFDNLPNWKNGNKASAADKFLVLNSSGVFVTYFFNGTKWLSNAGGLTDKGADVIPAGAGIYVDRSGTDTSSVAAWWTQNSP